MFDVTTKSMQWGEDTLTLETGKVARQADGSVIATLGNLSWRMSHSRKNKNLIGIFSP